MFTHKLSKLKTRLSGLILFSGGMLFGFICLLLSLSSGSQFTPMTAIIVPLFFCTFMENGYSLMKQTVYRTESWNETQAQDKFQSFGKGLNHFLLVKNFLGTILSLIFLSTIMVGISYFILKYEKDFSLNREFYIQIATYGVYIAILRRMMDPILNKLKKWGQILLPKYELDPTGINFIFTDKDLSHPDRKFTIHVSFDEIIEMRLLNFQEAKAYLRYEFAPNLKQQSSAPKEWYAFLKNNIRPKVYTKIQSGGSTILLRGENLFYLITVNSPDCTDILAAYENRTKL
ncbi:MAG: hypothetical protein WC777_02990 [Candidatus Gracilibacteria bacterium]|jgi:hypothetical protein